MKIEYSDNINKYVGEIIDEDDRIAYYLKNHGKDNIIRSFKYTNKNNKKKAYEKALKFKKTYSYKINKYKNAYSYNDDGSISVYFRQNKVMLIDKEDIDLLNDFIWNIKLTTPNVIKCNFEKNKVFSKYIPYLESINRYRNFKKLAKYQSITFVFLKYGSKKNIIYKNGNELDLRICNIENSSIPQNNMFMYSNTINNNTKINELHFITDNCNNDDNYWCVKALLNDENIIRKFSTKKYGNLIAKKLAKEFRDRLKNNGYEII